MFYDSVKKEKKNSKIPRGSQKTENTVVNKMKRKTNSARNTTLQTTARVTRTYKDSYEFK